MADYTELKRLAEAVNQTYADLCEHGGDELAEAWDSAELAYDDAANPDVVLALIAENERVKARLCVCRDCGGQGEVYSGHSSYQGHNQPPEPDMDVCGTCGGDGVLGSLEDFEALAAERDQLKAENDLLKSDNREMLKFKEHMVELRETHGFDSWAAALVEVDRLKAENEALRKRIDDMSPFKGAPLTGQDTKCLACGGYHYGMGGLPCPNMRVTAQTDLPETRSGQIGGAMGKGEQS